MRDNKGLSLVELLIAIAIAAIVSGSIAYFLVTSMRMYGNEMADASMQQEVRTAYNLIEGYIKEAQYIAIGNFKEKNDSDAEGVDEVGSVITPGKTKYLVLGTMEEELNEGKGYYINHHFKGVLIVADRAVLENDYVDGSEPVNGHLYIKTYDYDIDGDDDSNPDKKYNLTKPGNIANEVNEILKPENHNKYLLASNIQNFCVIPENMAPDGTTIVNPGKVSKPEEGKNNGYSLWESTLKEKVGVEMKDVPKFYYINNVSLNLKITAAQKGATRVEKKTLNESIMIRNHMTQDILVNDVEDGHKFKEYYNAAH